MGSAPGIPEERARALAREWHAASGQWAAKFNRALGQPPGFDCGNFETALRRETLAFALRLLELRFNSQNLAGIDGVLRTMRDEFSRARQAEDSLSFAWRRLAEPAGGEPDCQFTRAYRQWAGGNVEGSAISAEAFADFCSETGLGSNVLVGSGENLASVIFYLTLHGHGLAAAKVTIERKRCLLRAGRECRAYLQRSIDLALAPTPAAPAAIRPSPQPRGWLS